MDDPRVAGASPGVQSSPLSSGTRSNSCGKPRANHSATMSNCGCVSATSPGGEYAMLPCGENGGDYQREGQGGEA